MIKDLLLSITFASLLLFGLSGCKKSVDYPAATRGKVVNIVGTVVLTEDTVGNKYYIQDDSTLDCDGHTIRASRDNGRTDHAINLYGNNSTITNCVIDGYISGVNVDSRIPLSDQYKIGQLSKEDAIVYIDQLRERSKRGKTISNNRFINIVKTPVFVQMFARDTQIKDNSFESAGTMAIYLDAYSSAATITGNTITGSGYNHVSGREGIAIDASWGNIIVENHFSENNIAAITLYKNCGEKGMPRYYGANDNVIHDNHFNKEKKGVWIASRADRSRFPDCIDAPIYGNVARDVAQFNTVENNEYASTKVAVDIRDDNNRVVENKLNESVINEGSATRAAAGVPVANNVIADNEQ